MKHLAAVIQPFKLETVREALGKSGVKGITAVLIRTGENGRAAPIRPRSIPSIEIIEIYFSGFEAAGKIADISRGGLSIKTHRLPKVSGTRFACLMGLCRSRSHDFS